MHVISAKAVAFGLALKEEFKEYQKQVVKNAKIFSKYMQDKGFRIVSGGTDTHLFLVDLRPKNISGKKCALILEEVNITVNKNLIPFDPKPPAVASGIRIGTPAITTRGMKEEEMKRISEFINLALENKDNRSFLEELKREVIEFTRNFPLYEEIN
jgi:glycine hydroxymethyltransferase